VEFKDFLFTEVLKELRRLSVGNEIAGVLQIAIENDLTFYDASYLYLAKKYGLKMVTQDQNLLRFSEALNTLALLCKHWVCF
jgi:predicted nucleic acid-binding protein